MPVFIYLLFTYFNFSPLFDLKCARGRRMTSRRRHVNSCDLFYLPLKASATMQCAPGNEMKGFLFLCSLFPFAGCAHNARGAFEAKNIEADSGHHRTFSFTWTAPNQPSICMCWWCDRRSGTCFRSDEQRTWPFLLKVLYVCLATSRVTY